jgi:hypothetical protein
MSGAATMALRSHTFSTGAAFPHFRAVRNGQATLMRTERDGLTTWRMVDGNAINVMLTHWEGQGGAQGILDRISGLTVIRGLLMCRKWCRKPLIVRQLLCFCNRLHRGSERFAAVGAASCTCWLTTC